MPKRILIADDARLMRRMIESTLTAAGYEVVGQAVNGKEVVVLYEKLQPDLVTMDIVMPEVEGIEAIKQILCLNHEANIIVISSLGQNLLIEDAMKAGARAFLAKPFQPSELIKVIQDILGI